MANRQQFVSLNNSDYSPIEVLCGVPQGFSLGLLLVLVCVNDLHKAFVNLNITHFTDDANLWFHAMQLGNRIRRQL